MQDTDATTTAVEASPREACDDSMLGGRLESGPGLAYVGRYALLRELGRGAMGVVYAAYHEGLDRRLAIKLLHPQRVGRVDLEARLRREARALAKLSHPNVVQVYDVGEFEGRMFVAMEFVEGQTLSEWMRGEHTVEAILAMFADAGRGLAAAHAAGVIHRDFKPDNVLVGADGRPRVLDFGLARPLEPTATLELTRSVDHGGASGSFGTSLDQLLRTGEFAALEHRSAHARAPAPDDPDATLDGFAPGFPGDDPELSQDAISTRTNAVPGEQRGDPRAGEPRAPELPDEHRKSSSLTATRDADDQVLASELHELDEDQLITRTGALIGTPAYMSPEQFRGQHIDRASDQFSFCVALHEALYGHRPFMGKNTTQLRLAVEAGDIVEAPPNTRVPSWVREVILRGLSPAPEQRFANMDELIAALERERELPRRRWPIALAVAGIGALAFAIGLLAPERASPCPNVDDSAAQLWTSAQAAQLREAFTRSRLPYADATWTSVEPRMQAWTQAWASERVDACEATHLRQEFSNEALALREACLDQAARGYQTLIAQLADLTAAPRVIEHAIQAVAALPDPGRCSDVDELLSEIVAPDADVEAIGRLRGELAQLDMRTELGDVEPSLPLAEAALERARASKHGPLITEALLIYGRLLADTGAPELALERLQDALDEAERSDDDARIPLVAIELVEVALALAPTLELERARVWARRAITGLDRLNTADHTSASVMSRASAHASWGLANIELLAGEHAAAIEHLREAIALLDEHAPADPDRPSMLVDLGRVHAASGELDDADTYYQRALAAAVATFGPGHPRVGDAHYALARFAFERSRHAAANEQLDLARGIYLQARGPGHPELGHVELLRARVAFALGHLDEASTYATYASDIFGREGEADPLAHAESRLLLARVAFTQARLDDAIAQYRAGLVIQRSALAPDHVQMAATHTELGAAYLAKGEPELAIEQLDRGVELLEGADAPTPLRRARIDLGEALLTRAAPDDARRATISFEAAYTGCERGSALCEAAALGAARACALAGDALAEQRWRERASRSGANNE